MPVFHLDIEAFMTTVARVKDRSLRARPLVVAPERGRPTVMAASPDAKALGIRREMPVPYVLKNFPGIQVIAPDFGLYDNAQRYVLGVVGRYSPIVESVSYGHVAMDMTGMRQLFGSLENAALKLSREIKQCANLSTTVGIASNKLVSTIAAKEVQKEREPLFEVAYGSEARYLAPLPCMALPEWDEQRIRKLLFELNLKKVKQIQGIPRDIFSFALGETGAELYKHAMGVDPRPVTPSANSRQIVAEHRFFPDTNNDHEIRASIWSLLENLCYRLRSRGLAADQIRVAIKYTDDVWAKRQYKFAHTQKEQPIHEAIMRHYERLCDRRRRVRYLSLTMGGLHNWRQQPGLFECSKSSKIAPHLDDLRRRFGAAAIQYGKGVKAANIQQDLSMMDHQRQEAS